MPGNDSRREHTLWKSSICRLYQSCVGVLLKMPGNDCRR
ncbi:hypothetical protein LSAT2_011779, partial [Lamellibrachia satsuma]